jgi:electron transfer flavoprotein alpha subunit
MSVLIYIDQSEGHIKKSALEALSYGAAVAKATGVAAEGIILGETKEDLAALGKYGISKVHTVADAQLNHMDAQQYAASGATILVFSHNLTGKSVAPRVSAKLKAGLVAGAVALPDLSNGFSVRKSVFSGKAFADISITTPVKIISLNPNAYTVSVGEGTAAVAPLQVTVPAARVKVTNTSKVSGSVPLGEAELVVSGGRGLKGPEHWGMVEDLAGLIGAATACSRAVADAHWRPHHEHVGQTGLAIAPNLYFAIGISGAIQHLAGVNRSKVIVVVNKDPEAPFFKAADYGIVGDAFEVMPKVIDAVRKLKGK